MDEEIGVRVTRSRRRLSVENNGDTNSPIGTPTTKKNQKVALKPLLDNIGENEVAESPKRTTRRSMASGPDDAVLTPSKRTTRVRSNTSLSSVAESPRALRSTRRNSLLVESELPSKITPSKIKVVRRVSLDHNSISKDENGNTPKHPTMKELDQNLQLTKTPTLVDETNKTHSNINDFTVANLEVKLDPIEEQIFKITPPKVSGNKDIDSDITNIDRFAVALLEINIDDKNINNKIQSTTPPNILRKSPRLKSKDSNKSPEKLSSDDADKMLKDQQNETADALDEVILIEDTPNKILVSESNSKHERSFGLNISVEQNASKDNCNKVVAKEMNGISPSNKENESLLSTDKGNASRKSMLNESEHGHTNESINRQTRSSSKMSPIVSVLSSSSSQKFRNSLETNKSANISSGILNISLEQKKESKIKGSQEINIDEAKENVNQQNSYKKKNSKSSVESKDTEVLIDIDVDGKDNGKISLDNAIKPENITSKSKNNNIKDIEKLSHQQSTKIFSTIIMDDEKPNDIAHFSTENKKNPVVVLKELQKISTTHIEKSVDNKSSIDDDISVDDANISNIVAGTKAEEHKAAKKNLNNSNSTSAIENIKEKVNVAYAELKNDISEQLREDVNEGSNRRKSGTRQNNSKSFSNDSTDFSNVRYKLRSSVHDTSQFTPKKTTESHKLGLASSTPKVENIKDIKISKNSAPTNKKNVQLQNSDEDSNSTENDLLDSEAVDAGDDYESGDSLKTDEMEEMEQNEVKEKGETLNTDDESTGDSDYEKDSFLVSSNGEDEALLSGTGDDLNSSDNELTQSAKSREKYNKRMSKERKQASREMYEARHGIEKNKKTKRKISSKKIETDSSESNDSEIILKKSANQSKMRLSSSSDISKSQTEKEISFAQLYEETFVNDSNAKDPLSYTLPFKKRSLSTSSNKSKENVKSSPIILQHNTSKEGEIQQIEIDENKSMHLNEDKTTDPLSNIDYDNGDLTSLSSVDTNVVDDYNSVLSVLNQTNNSNVDESSSNESENKKNLKKSLTKTSELVANAPSSVDNEDIVKSNTELDISMIDCSKIDIVSKNASNMSLSICNSSKVEENANENGQDLITRRSSDVEVSVKAGKANEKRKYKEVSILNNDISTSDVEICNLNNTSGISNTKQSVHSPDNKFDKAEDINCDTKSRKKTKKSFNNSAEPDMQNVGNKIDKLAEEVGVNSESKIFNNSMDKTEIKSSLEDAKNLIPKKSKNKLKNHSLNFNEVSNDSLLENESLIDNLNLTLSKMKREKCTSIVNFTDTDATLNAANLSKSKATPCINSECAVEDDKKNKDDDEKTTIELEFIVEDDSIKSKEKRKKNKVKDQSLSIVENGSEESFSANASIIDNLNLTVMKKKNGKKSSESCNIRRSQEEEIVNNSKRGGDKELGSTKVTEDSNNDTKIKKTKKKRNKNKTLNSENSSDALQESTIDDLNLTSPNKKNEEHKDDSSYWETNNGKDSSVMVTAETFNSDNGDLNMKLFYGSTKNTEDGNNDTKIKKTKKKRNKNKTLNSENSSDALQESIIDDLNLTSPNKRKKEYKDDSFYWETNNGKDSSVMVTAETLNSDSDDLNVKLLFSSDEEIESVSAKVEDILSCTAMKIDESSEENEQCFPLKKSEAKTNLIAKRKESLNEIDNAITVQIPESADCEKIAKKRTKRNKKRKVDIKTEVADTTKTENGICTEEPSPNTVSDNNSPEEKTSKKRRRKRKQKRDTSDSKTAKLIEEEVVQKQEVYLETGDHKEQEAHGPARKAKKRKLKEEQAMTEYKKTKLSTTGEDRPNEIQRLPQTFLDQLNRATKEMFSKIQVAKPISTSEFKVDRASKRKAKPSEYLEESILVSAEPNWTSNTGIMRTVKKPKLLPSIPSVSASSEGFTTQFKVVPLIKEKQRKDARIDSEHAVRNFKTDILYGKRIKRVTTEQLVRKNSNPRFW